MATIHDPAELLSIPRGYQIQAFLRVASLSVALYDFLETFPTTCRFYKKQWRLRKLTVSGGLFILLQFSSIVVLTLSSIGFFYNNFDDRLCARFFLLPPIFKVIQSMVSQAILGVRVYNLSKRSEKVLYAGLFVYLVSSSLQWVTTLLDRQALIGNGAHNCRAYNDGGGRIGAYVFYAVAMAYDVLAISTSIFFLLKYKLTSTSSDIMSKLGKMMLYDGLGYLVALTVVNTLNLILYRTATEIQSAAASLAYCLTWIMSQRLLVHLYDASRDRRLESEADVITFTQDIYSPREISEVFRGQFEEKQFPLKHQLNRSDLENTFPGVDSRDFSVHVRVERTVKVHRQARTAQLEDYSHRGRRAALLRNINTPHVTVS